MNTPSKKQVLDYLKRTGGRGIEMPKRYKFNGACYSPGHIIVVADSPEEARAKAERGDWEFIEVEDDAYDFDVQDDDGPEEESGNVRIP